MNLIIFIIVLCVHSSFCSECKRAEAESKEPRMELNDMMKDCKYVYNFVHIKIIGEKKDKIIKVNGILVHLVNDLSISTCEGLLMIYFRNMLPLL